MKLKLSQLFSCSNRSIFSQPKWQLRLIATLLIVIAGVRNDIIFAFVAGLMFGWAFSYEGTK
jgi:hypothetical protein